MSGDTLFNTSDIVAEVAVVEKSLDKLSQQIRALNTAKVDAIQAELKKLGSSTSTGVQEMAASIKSALDSALQLQKDYASGSLNITKREYATRLEEAKNSIATTALLEKQGFRSLLDDRKVYLAEKANLEKLAGIEAKRQALEQSLIANSQTPNSARDLVLNTKYVGDLEKAKLEIIEKGSSATLAAIGRREQAIIRMLQTGGEGALAIAQKKYGTDFVSVVKAGLDKEAEILARHAEATLALKRAQHEAMILEGRRGAAVLEAGLQSDLLKDELLYQQHQARLIADTETAMGKLWAVEKAARAKSAAGLQADLIKDELYHQEHQARLIADTETAMGKLWAVEKAARARNAAGLQADLLKDELHYQEHQARVIADTETAMSKLWAVEKAARARNARGLQEDLLRDEVRYQAEQAAIRAAKPSGAGGASQVLGLSSAFKQLSIDGNDVHSMARGLASGFNALWLTWGNLVPLLAGAAISMSFVKSVKAGAEFAESLFVIQELAGATGQEITTLSASVLKMGETTQYGPLKLVEGLKVLTLAGYSAADAMTALTPTLNFAAAGGITVEAAAATLVAVSTAYKFAAADIAVVGDIIASTAANTMASVSDMSEAFKTSSVLAQQYGVTLYDTADALGMLAQIGIKGTAAGTSWRNMLTEFNKGSGKAAEGIKMLGVELKNIDGSGKGVMDIMQSMSVGLITKTSRAQDLFLQDMTNERGAKATAAFQSELLTLLHKTNPQLQEQADSFFKVGNVAAGNKVLLDAVAKGYEKIKEEAEKAKTAALGFTFFANLEAQFTPLKQFEGALASLQTTFIKAFGAAEGSLAEFALLLRASFNSEGFQSTVASIVGGIGSFALAASNAIRTTADIVRWAADNITLSLGIVLAAYTGYGLATAAASAATVWLTGVIAASTFVTGTNTAAVIAGAGAKAGATVATGLYATSVLWLTGAVGALNVALAAVGITIAVTTGWVVAIAAAILTTIGLVLTLGDSYKRAGDNAAESAAKQLKANAEVAKDKLASTEMIMDMQRDQLTEEVAKIGLLNKTKAENAVKEAAARAQDVLAAAAKSKKNFEVEKEHLDKASEIRGTMVSKEVADAKVAGEAMVARINQWREYRLTLADAAADLASLDGAMRFLGIGDTNGDAFRRAAIEDKLAAKKSDINYEAEGRISAARAETASLVDLMRVQAAVAAAEAAASGKKLQGVDPKTPADLAKEAKDAAKKAKALEKDSEFDDARRAVAALEKQNKAIASATDTAASAESKTLKFSYDAGVIAYEKYQEELTKVQDKHFKDRADQLTKQITENEALKAKLIAAAAKEPTKKGDLKPALDVADANALNAKTSLQKLNIDDTERQRAAFLESNNEIIKLNKSSEKQLADLDANVKLEVDKLNVLNDISGLTEKSIYASERDKFIQEGVLDISKNHNAQLRERVVLLAAALKTGALKHLGEENEDGVPTEKGVAAAANYTKILADIEEYKSKAIEAEQKIAAARGKAFDNKKLNEWLDPAKAKTFGEELKGAFGKSGDAMSKLADAYTAYAEKQKNLTSAQEEHDKSSERGEDWYEKRKKLTELQTAASLEGYAAMAGAAKGMFAEQTAGYKLINTIETAVHLMQMANMAEKVASGIIATASSVTQSGITFAAAAPGAIAKAGSQTGWVGAIAMAALMASLGYAAYTGSGVSGDMPESSKDRQARQGRGTVLGDDESLSSSLTNALESMKDNTFEQLKYSSGMLDALKGIQRSMAGLSQIIFRTVGITSGNAFGVVESSRGLNATTEGPFGAAFGKALVNMRQIIGGAFGPQIGGLLEKFGGKLDGLIGSLWGKVSTSISDSGLSIDGALGDLTQGRGFSQYADVKTTRSSFFGLVKKDSYSKESGALQQDAADQLAGVFRGISASLQEATTSFGADANTIASQLAASVISIPAISLRGLKGAALQEALNSVFSGEADKLARAIAPGFEALQKVGEGYYETVIRASNALMTVNGQLARMGQRVLAVSTAGAFAAASLAELFGGINELNDASQQFYEDYYSDAERAAQSVKDMTQALSTVNLALPNSKEELRALASTLDLNTDAGRKAYTVLLTIAPQFAKTAETVAQSSKDIAASILKALTGNGTLVPALDAVRLNALRLKDTLFTGVVIGLTGAQEAAGFLSAEIEDLRDGAARATIDMAGLSTALAKADTATFVSTIALVFENLADRIKGVVNKVADERIAVRTAALQIMNPGVMNKDAIGRGISAEQPILVAGTRAADAAKAALLIAQAGLQRADARVDADRAALAASSAQPVSRVALEAAAAALAAAGPALRAQLAPQFTTEGTPGYFGYNGGGDAAESQNVLYMPGTSATVNEGGLEAAVAAAMLPYQDTYNQKIAEFNAATAKLATGVASSSVALNTTLQQQAAAVAVAKDRQLAYTAALQGFTIDAGRSVTRLGNLREETLKYYEAQKQLADLMGNSAKGLRESVRQTRMGQLDSTQSLTQKRADFDKNYSLALSTTGETQVGYADKLAAALPELSTAMMDVATTRQEWAVSVASAMAKSEKIAALLEANAPKDFAADSLNMLRQIDIALIGIDATSKSAEKSITDAVTAGSSKIADGLRAVIAAVTGGPVPAFATGGAFTNGVVSRPTMFNMGVMGEAGSEAIMPLTNIGGQLGVRAISNGSGRDNARLEALVEKLTQQVAELSSETKAIALYTFKTADILKSVTPDRDAIATRVAV